MEGTAWVRCSGVRALYKGLSACKGLICLNNGQTDPNWGNFLYDEATDVINLIDFGAARGYPKHFVDDYLEMVFTFFTFPVFSVVLASPFPLLLFPCLVFILMMTSSDESL
jgi:hypothetical protein